MKNYCIEWTEPCNTINCGLECSGEHICGSYAQGNNSWDAVADFYRMACFPEVNNISNVLTEDEAAKRYEEEYPRQKTVTISIPISLSVGTKAGAPHIIDSKYIHISLEERIKTYEAVVNQLLLNAVQKHLGSDYKIFNVNNNELYIHKIVLEGDEYDDGSQQCVYHSWNEETLEYDISVFSPEEEALLKKGNMRADRKKK